MPPVHPVVVQRLLALNATFYQAHARSFAMTRRRPQPGVEAVLQSIDRSASLLDIGCGHGVVARQLALQGHLGGYIGIDASPDLLELARQAVRQPGFAFASADLAQPGWCDGLTPAVSVIVAFAVLHHLPGEALRQRVVSDLAQLLDTVGKVEVSVWNFLELERLRRRVIPWDRLGLADSDVDAGDCLLDWRQGGRGLRYVHHFTPAELAALAGSAGLATLAQRYSDGENGRLGLYQTWSWPG